MARNPFGVEDVPHPDGADVEAFAASVRLPGSIDDPNAATWADLRQDDQSSIEGRWSSRWNGDGLDWQVGHGEVRLDRDRGSVFILFDWDGGRKQGLIEARRESDDRLVGRYLNLDTPEITRPWVGLIVDPTRIDGKHPGGPDRLSPMNPPADKHDRTWCRNRDSRRSSPRQQTEPRSRHAVSLPA